jgi:hypothetical protein
MPKVCDTDAIQRIADALEKHCDLHIGDISQCDDPDRFADLVETAARNRGPIPRKKKNDLAKLPVQMSHRRTPKRVRMSQTRQPAPGDVAGWFSRIVYGDLPPNN